jgi:hypothetical protein
MNMYNPNCAEGCLVNPTLRHLSLPINSDRQVCAAEVFTRCPLGSGHRKSTQSKLQTSEHCFIVLKSSLCFVLSKIF